MAEPSGTPFEILAAEAAVLTSLRVLPARALTTAPYFEDTFRLLPIQPDIAPPLFLLFFQWLFSSYFLFIFQFTLSPLAGWPDIFIQAFRDTG